MSKAIFAYLFGCVGYAWRGSINSALNWASIVGVGVVGAYLEKRGSIMSDPHTWYGIVGWTIIYTASAWAVIFVFRFAVIAPFHLWRSQKDRADKLEGIVPTAILSRRRKPLAILQARYLAAKAPIQREALDHEADSLQVVQDLQVIFNGVSVETQDMTKLMLKNNKKIHSIKEPQKKRQAIKVLADHLNSYSDRVQEFATTIRGMTPVMLECTGKFLERMVPNVGRPTLNTFIVALDGAIKSIAENVTSASGASESLSANYKGITHDLNTAISRVESAIELYKASLNEYLSVCEQIKTLANERFDDDKENRNDTAFRATLAGNG